MTTKPSKKKDYLYCLKIYDNELRNKICLYIFKIKKKGHDRQTPWTVFILPENNGLRNKNKIYLYFFFRFVGNAWEFLFAGCVPKSGLKLMLYINIR